MPKPFGHVTGKGSHVQVSLADAGSRDNLFEDPAADLGLSKLGRWFLGGVLAHARALSAIVAPIVNSYKRLIRGAPRSGATWAPVCITYGASNTTQMVRIPGPGRFEIRAKDGAPNPYLALAAILASGLDGIACQTEPGAVNDGNMYETPEEELAARGIGLLPTTLSEALDALERDCVVQGAPGFEYAKEYVRVKREEWRQFNQTVTEWERNRYLVSYQATRPLQFEVPHGKRNQRPAVIKRDR